MTSKKTVQFVTSNTGIISQLTFKRPAAKETRFTIQLPLPNDGTDRAMVEKSYYRRAKMDVVAYDPKDKCAFQCGTFTVTGRSKTTFTLQKHIHAVMKEARETTLNQLENKKKLVAQPVPVVFLPPSDATKEPPQVQLPPVVEAPQPFGFAPVQLVAHSAVYARPPQQTAQVQPKTTTITAFFGRTNLPKAIPTTYNGINFRSRLESKFARMLDAFHIRFVYEPMRVRTGDKGSYTIDFFIPDQQLYVELKPKRPHVEEERKCEDMSKMGFRVVLMYGDKFYKLPYRSEFYKNRSHRDYDHHDAVRGMCWVNGSKLAGDTVFVVGAHDAYTTPLDVPSTTVIHMNQVQSTYDMRWNHPVIKDALQSLKFM